MRHRKIKDLENKLLNYQRYFAGSAAEHKGGWNRVFENGDGIYFELGAGKGQFIIGQAEEHSERNYIGAEGRLSVVFRALQKLEETGLSNVRFVCRFVNDPQELFSDGELSGIYLNFCDPWPKKRHSRRRLTHREYLLKYHSILERGGTVEFKTDNFELFKFTRDEIADAAAGMFRVSAITDDLHGSDLSAKNITSEYEEKFIAAGRCIYYIKMIKV